jgi:PPOX class probable F420-dependent enzyme
MAKDDEYLRRLAAEAHQAVLATTRPDGTVHASLVSAGVMVDPVRSSLAVAAVVMGRARKLAYLRASGRAAATFVHGFEWVTAEGPISIIGPDDPHEAVPAATVPQLLRDVFTAAGGTHENWIEYDRVMAEERRTAVFIHVERTYRNR